MKEREKAGHLSMTATLWSVVRRAHQGPEDAAASAREQLLEQYRQPVSRYLLGALRDADAAEELFQEFALRFLRGDFHRADPERGRFRAYLKTALYRLVVAYYRGQKGRPGPLPEQLDDEPACASGGGLNLSDSDVAFTRSWRETLLTRAWEGLARLEESTGQPVYTVLRFRSEHPDMPSARMAEQLGARLGKPLTAAATRQALYRAREKFSDLLLEQVAQTLEEPTADRLAEELLDLGLLDYCRPALDRLRAQESAGEKG
jgi:RNA polymerase sigma-70 factor (ECF subfamily)